MLTNWNHAISDENVRNEVCLGQNTRSDALFADLILSNEDLSLYNQWIKILNIAKSKQEFIKNTHMDFIKLKKK